MTHDVRSALLRPRRGPSALSPITLGDSITALSNPILTSRKLPVVVLTGALSIAPSHGSAQAPLDQARTILHAGAQDNSAYQRVLTMWVLPTLGWRYEAMLRCCQT